MVVDAEEYTEKAVAEGVVVPSLDPAGRAKFISAAVLGGALTHLLGEEPDPRRSMAGWLEQMTLPALELYTQGLLADSTMLDAYLTYMKDPPEGGVDRV